MLRALIDWVSVTIKTHDLNEIYHLLGVPESEFSDMETGLHGYRQQKACGNIRILYDGNSDMGIHIQMSGDGCREFENYYSDWDSFLRECIERDANFSRLDIAIDDIRYHGEKPYFTLRQLIGKLKRNECRSKFRKAIRIETITLDGGQSSGQTVYFGSASSSIRIRIYEKNFERLADDQELEEGLTTWNRFEVEMKDERANLCVLALLSGLPIGEVVKGIISNYIEIVDKQKNDSNKARWPRTKWWHDFIGNVEKLKLSMKAPDKTVPEIRSWVERQVGPSLALLNKAYGNDNWLIDLLKQSIERLTEAQEKKAKQFNQAYKNERIKIADFKEVTFANQVRLSSSYFSRVKKSISSSSSLLSKI